MAFSSASIIHTRFSHTSLCIIAQSDKVKKAEETLNDSELKEHRKHFKTPDRFQ